MSGRRPEPKECLSDPPTVRELAGMAAAVCSDLSLLLDPVIDRSSSEAGAALFAQLGWAVEGVQACLRDRFGFPSEAAQSVRAVSAGPPDGWPGCTAVEAAARLAGCALTAGLRAAVPGGEWIRVADLERRFPQHPGGLPPAAVGRVLAAVRDPVTYTRSGLPHPTPAALERLMEAVAREVARATAGSFPAGPFGPRPAMTTPAPEPEPEPVPPKPTWDDQSRTIRYAGRAYRYRNRAGTQTRILAAFQEEGWPERIDCPVSDGQRKNAIRDLNKRLVAGIGLRFLCDGTGEGIRWAASPLPPSPAAPPSVPHRSPLPETHSVE